MTQLWKAARLVILKIILEDLSRSARSCLVESFSVSLCRDIKYPALIIFLVLPDTDLGMALVIVPIYMSRILQVTVSHFTVCLLLNTFQ